jgi:purine-binding chemotaxis protein CheW
MTRKSTTNEDTPQEAVQNYLDLMLRSEPASEVPESQVSQLPERAMRSSLTKVSTSLAMVGGTAVSAAPASRRKRHGDTPTLKPFAEPVKPLTLKIPLSTVQPETDLSPDINALHQDAITEPVLPVVESKLKQRVNEQSQPFVTPSDKPPELELPTVRPESVCEPEAGLDTDILDTDILDTDIEAGIDTEQVETPQARFQPTPWLENGRPCWAQERFECLLFSVGGLALAVPLVELGTIYPLDNELTPIFGQADWFLGLLSVKGVNIRTVNTGKVVMPERYNGTMEETFSYVITINGVDWGLAVDSVSTAITLVPEDVRWRTQRSKRPWLAGTVVEKMCALLDVSQLAAMFVDQDRPQA